MLARGRVAGLLPCASVSRSLKVSERFSRSLARLPSSARMRKNSPEFDFGDSATAVNFEIDQPAIILFLSKSFDNNPFLQKLLPL